MNEVPILDLERSALGRAARMGGRTRFVLLIVVFNVLLFAIAFLAFQQRDLKVELIELERTHAVYEEIIREQRYTHTQIITQVMPYGWSP